MTWRAHRRDHEEHREADRGTADRGDQEVGADAATSRRPPAPAAIAVRRATSAVASLKSDSPSRIVTIRRGRPIRRPIAVAATASGGATTAPIAIAAHQSMPGRRAWTSTPTPSVVKTTRPTLSSRIDAAVGVEVDERGLDRRGVQQRRQQAEQYDVRAEVDGRARRGRTTPRRRRRSARAARGSERVRRAPSRRARRSPAPPARTRSPRGHSCRAPATARITPGPRPTASGRPSPARRGRGGSSASTTSVRRYAANVSTWAIIPPYVNTSACSQSASTNVSSIRPWSQTSRTWAR